MFWVLRYVDVWFEGECCPIRLGDVIGQQAVTWQAGLVPARTATWGRIKSLYR